MTERSIRFGVISERVRTRSEWIAQAQRAEALDYATFLIRDHVAPDVFGVQLGPIAALATAAAVTSTLRIGTLVLANDYRHPAILAKEAATLDLLSDGRLELGLGAGWLHSEYDQMGMPFDPNGVRVSRMTEGVQVLKGLLTGEPFSLSGTFYQIENLETFPPPVQRPYPPILIGGGHQRVLTLAGQEADIVSILTTSVASGTVEDDPHDRRADRVAERIGWVRDGAGERFSTIDLSLIPTIIVTDQRRTETDAQIASRGWSGITRDDVWDMPSILIGSIDQMTEDIQRWRAELGLTYFVVSSDVMEAFAPVVARLAGGARLN